MSLPASPLGPEARLVQFDRFEVDLNAGELRKCGIRIPLPDQAFQILVTLLERPGQIVGRDELHARLWQDDTFVDFDQCLYVRMNKLREVLSDSPRQPRFIETVRGRGYRFIAPIATLPTQEVKAALEIVIAAEPVQPPRAGPIALTARPLSWKWALVLLAFALALGVRGLWSRMSPAALPTVHAITTFSGSKDFAALSPDGQRVAFTWVGPGDRSRSFSSDKKRNIYVKLVDAGEPLALTKSNADELYPAWSPDGLYIAFLRKNGSSLSVYVVPSMGGPERKICDGGAGLAWSPDGQTLALASVPDSADRSHIELRSLVTGEQRVLTRPDPTVSDSLPTFSPDGKTVAFMRNFTFSAREVMTVPVNGGEPRRLTSDQRPMWGLTWTHDGKGIVFSSNRMGGEQLWRVPAVGGAPTKLGFIPQNAMFPRSSLHSDRLVYTQVYVDENIYLYQTVAPQNDASQEPRVDPWRGGFGAAKAVIRSTRADHSPQFSPDNQRITFVSNRTGSDEIWVARLDGSESTQLTSFNGSATGSPRWSPDGRWIAFDSRAAGSGDVWVIRSDGSGLHRLTTGPADEILPAWSRDGRFIYYRVRAGRSGQIFKKRFDGNDPATQLTRGGALEAWESPDGRLLYFTRNYWESGIWSVRTDGGEEKRVDGLAEAGYYRSWGVMPKGLYFATAGPESRSTIKFYEFARRRTTPLMTVDTEALWLSPGLAMSSDGQSVLFAQLDQAVNDLMLIDHVR